MGRGERNARAVLGNKTRALPDWIAIKADYVEGHPQDDGTVRLPTLDEVARKHGLNPSYVRRQAAKQHWSDERDQWQTRRQQIRREELEGAERATAERIAKRISELESRSLLISEAGLARVAKLMAQERLKANDLVNLASAMQTFQRIYRLIGNEPTDKTETTASLGAGPWADIVADVLDRKLEAELVRRAQRDPVWWTERFLGDRLWSKQGEIMEAVRDNKRTLVRSCHGPGKSFTAARVALWFLTCFPNSIVLTTAPTFRQVKIVLWAEIGLAYANAVVPLGGEMLSTLLRFGEKWFALGFATDRPDAFQGVHAPHVMVILDEGSGIGLPIWTAAEGVLTGDHCRLLAIGNPTDITSQFHKEFQLPGSAKIHISAFDTPNFTEWGVTLDDIRSGDWQRKVERVNHKSLITPEWVADKFVRWGEGSPMWQARVLGEFPDQGSNALIRMAWVAAAQQRTLEAKGRKVLGVDVARKGEDSTVIGLAHGPVYRRISKRHKEDTMQTVGRVVRALDETGAEEARIDDVGLGGGVVDRLNELRREGRIKARIIPMIAGASARDSEHFYLIRSEWHWGLRERFEAGDIDIDPQDEDLASQATSILFTHSSRGQIVVESKDDMRGRQLPSPDDFDACMLAYAMPGKQAPTGFNIATVMGGAGIRI